MAKKKKYTLGTTCQVGTIARRKMGKLGYRCTCITDKGMWRTLKAFKCQAGKASRKARK